jgi:hypothetical protein
MTRGGLACRSITLIVSASPWPKPMFAVTAIRPGAQTSMP